MSAWRLIVMSLSTPPPIARLSETEIADLRRRQADAIHRSLTPATAARLTDLVAQATEHYQEQDRRAERTERRATALQNSVSVAAALVAASSSLLLGSNRLQTDLERIACGLLTLFVVGALVMAALLALQATSVQHTWHRPNNPASIVFRAGLASNREFDVETLGALLAAIERNQAIAQWKVDRLRFARRLFRLGLLGLLVFIALIIGLAVSSGPTKDDRAAKPTVTATPSPAPSPAQTPSRTPTPTP